MVWTKVASALEGLKFDTDIGKEENINGILSLLTTHSNLATESWSPYQVD